MFSKKIFDLMKDKKTKPKKLTIASIPKFELIDIYVMDLKKLILENVFYHYFQLLPLELYTGKLF
jgi:hypothetical protein